MRNQVEQGQVSYSMLTTLTIIAHLHITAVARSITTMADIVVRGLTFPGCTLIAAIWQAKAPGTALIITSQKH